MAIRETNRYQLSRLSRQQNPVRAQTPMEKASMTSTTLIGGQVLLADGSLAETTVTFADGAIKSVGGFAEGQEIDASGCYVLPGIVDLHGDAFERQMMPRGGVSFPIELALQDTDSQLVSNGITTAYHSVTYAWEPGLRGREPAVAIKNALVEMRDVLRCDTRYHLRHETHNLVAEDEICQWIDAGEIDLLAFNDHSDLTLKEIVHQGKSTATYTARTGLSHDEFIALLHDVVSRKPKVKDSVERIAAVAKGKGIAMASHDDYTVEMRQYYNDLGCSIAEFPMNSETAEHAISLDNPVICGSPNIVRGGSHLGGRGVTAAVEVRENRCNILVSDYYYPALAQAPFLLAANGDCSFADAWKLVSTNPARAAGLTDRGETTEGQRADLLVVRQLTPKLARVEATIAGGKLVHRVAPTLN